MPILPINPIRPLLSSFKLDDATACHHIAPFFHLADAFFIWSVTYQGGKHVMQRQFVSKAVLETMQNEKVTAAMMVPTMINFLLNVPEMESYDLSSLKDFSEDEQMAYITRTGLEVAGVDLK